MPPLFLWRLKMSNLRTPERGYNIYYGETPDSQDVKFQERIKASTVYKAANIFSKKYGIYGRVVMPTPYSTRRNKMHQFPHVLTESGEVYYVLSSVEEARLQDLKAGI